MLENIIELRKTLHRFPERSMHEEKTKSILRSFIAENTRFEVIDRGAWFYAVLRAENRKREPIAFRADFDAVCGQDGKPGHYCGHDGHSAVLCATAIRLSEMKNIDRDVYLIFQPGEETGEGGKICCELITEKGISEIYGLHNIPGHEKNHILLARGTFACASTGLRIYMKGTPSHAAYPEAGKNPGPELARLLLEIEKLTEDFNREKGFVRMTLIGFEAGSSNYGVAASEGELKLTVRAEKENIFKEYLEKIRLMAENRADLGGFDLELTEIERFPATENHEEGVLKLEACAKKNGLICEELKEPMRWSEDFGYYLQKTSGAFFGVGDGIEYAQLHTSAYEFPDEIMEAGIKMFTGLAVE